MNYLTTVSLYNIDNNPIFMGCLSFSLTVVKQKNCKIKDALLSCNELVFDVDLFLK